MQILLKKSTLSNNPSKTPSKLQMDKFYMVVDVVELAKMFLLICARKGTINQMDKLKM